MRGALCAPQPPAFRAGAENRPVDIYTNSIISAYKSVSANILLLFHAGNRRRKAGRRRPAFFYPPSMPPKHPRAAGLRPALRAPCHICPSAAAFRLRVPRRRFLRRHIPRLRLRVCTPVFQPFFRHANGRFGTCRSARNSARRFASGPGCSAVRRGARACREMRRASPVLRTRRRFRASPCAPSEAGPRAAPPPASFLAARPRSGRSAFAMIEQAVWCSLCAPLSLFAAFYSRAARLHTPAASRFTPPGSRRLPVAPAPATPCARPGRVFARLQCLPLAPDMRKPHFPNPA